LKLWIKASIGCGLALIFFRRRPSLSVVAGDREGWLQLEDEPGLAVRMPSRSWTSPAVRDVLREAARSAVLQVGDAGPEVRGASYPPHKSHQWGRDIDLGYTEDEYPTPIATPVSGRIVAALASIAPAIEVVYAGPSRIAALTGHGFKVAPWPGHEGHLHLRLRSDFVSRSATT